MYSHYATTQRTMSNDSLSLVEIQSGIYFSVRSKQVDRAWWFISFVQLTIRRPFEDLLVRHAMYIVQWGRYTLYCITLYCIVFRLYCITLYYITLYCITLYCIVLHYIAFHCSELYFIALQHHIAEYQATLSLHWINAGLIRARTIHSDSEWCSCYNGP